MHTVYETLQNLGVKDKPVITVFNKIDRMEDIWVPRDLHADYYVKISARDRRRNYRIPSICRSSIKGAESRD